MLGSTRIRFGAVVVGWLLAGSVVEAVPASAGTIGANARPALTTWTFVGLYGSPNAKQKCDEAGQDLIFSHQYRQYRCTPFPGIPGSYELDGGN